MRPRKPQNQDVKIRILAFGLAAAASLYGQYRHHHFSWQEACYKNPGAPYCAGNDFAIKPSKDAPPPRNTYSITDPSRSTIDAAGIDWRFADPAADALAVLNCRKLSASPLAHS